MRGLCQCVLHGSLLNEKCFRRRSWDVSKCSPGLLLPSFLLLTALLKQSAELGSAPPNSAIPSVSCGTAVNTRVGISPPVQKNGVHRAISTKW